MGKWVVLLLLIWMPHVKTMVHTPTVMTVILHVFHQSLHTNAGILSHIRPGIISNKLIKHITVKM